MRIVMLRHITGSRNGEPWPLKGGELDLPDHEAADLIAAGHAKEAPDAQPLDPMPADTADSAAGPDDAAAAVPEPDGAAGTVDDEPAPDLDALDKEQLIALAAARGIDVSARWGAARLRDTIAAAG
ncbi:MAG TPA: hypothetical protein P5254_16450 [Aquihabitans sp.]|nr:hypothetical protein [Aquihabitans sp.]